MKHPWRLFVAALAGSALVAVGFAAGVDRLSARQQPTPTLQSVSNASLASSGLTLFALGRTIGWIGHAIEQYRTGALIRPRAKYVGALPIAPG